MMMRFRLSLNTVAALAVGLLALAGCAGGIQDQGYSGSHRPKPSLHSNAVEFPVHGIDVSKYQGDIDWDRVRASGTKFAYIKATEGGDRADEKFVANWNGAKSVGVARGAYHFAYWCRPAQNQIEWFTSHVPYEADALPPVLDVEWITTSRTCPRKIPAWKAREEMQIMLNHMERTYGKRPVIYTTVDFYEDVLSEGAFSDYPIWVRSTKYEPNVKYGSRRWHFWQYQSDGRVAGIRGNVDKNAFHGSQAQWLAFAGGAAAPAAPEPAAAPVQTASIAPARDAAEKPAEETVATAAAEPSALAPVPTERVAVMRETTRVPRATIARAAFTPEPMARPVALARPPAKVPGAVAGLRPAALVPGATIADVIEADGAPLSLLPQSAQP
jgi:lysozyme